MSRFRTYTEGDDAAQMAGDMAFAGVDTRRNPRLLEPGLCSKAVNMSFRHGVAETRAAFRTVGWAGDAAPRWSYTQDDATAFPINFYLEQQMYAEASETSRLTHTTGNVGLTGVTKVSDGVRPEFEYTENNSNWWQEPEVGDRVIVSGFTDTNFNGNFLVSSRSGPATGAYGESTRIRVEPGWTAWDDAADDETSAANMTCEGCVHFSAPTGFGEVFGATVFSDPNGSEGVLLAVKRGVWRVAYGQVPQRIDLPTGVALDGPVEFIQAFDRVVMLRGYDAAPLVWNPLQTFADGLGDFEEIAEVGSGSASFLEVIPNSIHGVEFNGRLYLQCGRDQIAVSDVYDYTHYDPVFSAFRLNEGSDDHITRLLPFGDQRLVVFKDQSIELVSGLYGDLSDASGDMITRERGAVAGETVCYAGGGIMFLSEGGVYRLAQSGEGNLQLDPVAVSAPILPTMGRINRAYAHLSRAVVYEDRYYLAVPLDGSTVNNTILVWNFILGQWEGEWTADCLDVLNLLKANHGGQRRLFVLNGEGDGTDEDAEGSLLLVGSGLTDLVYGTEYEIASELLTRGYAVEMPERHLSKTLNVALSTWRPSYEISALVNGVGEEVDVSGVVTKSNTEYVIHSKADWDTTNVNGDHGDAYREDYSVGLDRVMLHGGIGATCSANASDEFVARDSERDWRSVAVSKDGSVLVASVDGGYLYVSTDSGETWAAKDSVRSWRGVAINEYGTRMAACAFGGYLYVSDDGGDTWNPRDAVRQWYDVAMSGIYGQHMVAGVYNGYIYTSVDYGGTWKEQVFSGARSWVSVAMNYAGLKMVAADSGGKLYRSSDKEHWYSAESDRDWVSVAMSHDGADCVACVDGGRVYISSDYGETWTATASVRNWQGVSRPYATEYVLAVSDDGVSLSSDGGESWVLVAAEGSWCGVGCSGDGATVAACTSGSYMHTAVIADLSSVVRQLAFTLPLVWTLPDETLIGSAYCLDVRDGRAGPYQGVWEIDGGNDTEYYSDWVYYTTVNDAVYDAAVAFGSWHVRDIAAVSGSTPLFLTGGVNPQRFQDSEKRYRVRRRGEWMQVRIINSQGALKLHRAVVEQVSGGRSYRGRT